ncbi:hypothetical protein ACTFIV_004168 [Dictyostelium citrinum]
METQLLSHNSSGEINLLNRNSSDNIRLSPLYNEQELLEQQELILKQQLMHNQQRQQQLQRQAAEAEQKRIMQQQKQQQQQQQQLLLQQQQQQQQLLLFEIGEEDEVKKGITRTSFFGAASRAILTNKFLSIMTKSLNTSQDLNNTTNSITNINININNNNNNNNNSKDIDNIRKLIEHGLYVQDLIPENQLSFVCDQLCIYDPFAIFFLDTEESKQLLLDSFQLFHSISPQQQFLINNNINNNIINNNNNNNNYNNNSNNNNVTYKDFIMKSHPIQSWLEFQKGGNSINKIGFRTKYIDQVIMDSLSIKGSVAHFNASAFFYTQVVFCGSGLDSRSLRLPIDKHVSVFEIDLPQVINYKRKVLEKATTILKPTSQCRINYIGGDIVKEGDRWIGSLIDCGFNPAMHTLWVLEGVLMYLTEEEIGTLLGSIGMLSAPNSKLLIHTVTPPNSKNNNGNPSQQCSTASVAHSINSSTNSTNRSFNFFKEEFVSFHSNPSELLNEFGFSKDITSVSYSDLNQLYLCNSPDFNSNPDCSRFSTGIFTG